MPEVVDDARYRPVLGPAHATWITVGAMIGSGIFSTPADVARRTGSTAASVAVWVVGALLTLLGAVSVAELGAALPASGGLYVWLRRAFGERLAFLFGWAMLVVLVPSSVAYFASVTANHVAPLVGVSPRAVSTVTVLGCAAVNALGVAPAAGVQVAVTVARVVALAAIGLGGTFLGDAPAAPSPSPTALGLAAAVVPVLWAYDGWIDVTSIGAELRDPARDVPRALVRGVALVALVYVLVTLGLHHALGTPRLAVTPAPGLALGEALGGLAARRAVGALVATSTVGACLVGMLTGTRVIAAMGTAGALLRPLGAVGVAGVPQRAIAVTAALALVYLGWAPATRLAEVFVVGAWPFYAAGALATVALRRKEPALHRPWKTPAYPWPIVGFVVVTALMIVAFAIDDRRSVLASFGLIAVGLPAHALVRLRRPRGV
ncbi:MAG: amino acid permease [Polyangiales bacterium]